MVAAFAPLALLIAIFYTFLFLWHRKRRMQRPARPGVEETGTERSVTPAPAALDPRPIEPDPIIRWGPILTLLFAIVVVLVKYESVVRLAVTLASWRVVEAADDGGRPTIRRGAWVLMDTRTRDLIPGRMAAYRIDDPPGYGFARLDALGPDTLARWPRIPRSLDGPGLVTPIGPGARWIALRSDACLLSASPGADSAAISLVMRRTRVRGRVMAVLSAPRPGHGPGRERSGDRLPR